MIWPHIWFLGGWNWIRYNDIINQNVFESYNRRNWYSAYFILKITHKIVNYSRLWLTFNCTSCRVRSVILRCCNALIVLLWCRRVGCSSGFLITAHSFYNTCILFLSEPGLPDRDLEVMHLSSEAKSQNCRVLPPYSFGMFSLGNHPATCEETWRYIGLLPKQGPTSQLISTHEVQVACGHRVSPSPASQPPQLIAWIPESSPLLTEDLLLNERAILSSLWVWDHSLHSRWWL